MPDLIDFQWELCPDGYEVLEFDPTGLEVKPLTLMKGGKQLGDPFGYDLIPSPDTPEATCVLLDEVDQSFLLHLLREVEDRPEFIRAKSPRRSPINPIRDHSGMFLELANTPVTQSSIIGFAEKYGLLRGSGPEYFGSWPITLDRLKTAVDIWSENKAKNDLNELVQAWNGREGRISIDVQLAKTAYPERPNICLVPATLQDAAWLQFAQAASASQDLKKCRWCTTWFAFGSGTGRKKSAEYCSDKCRVTAFRKRKEAAADAR